MDGGVSRPWWHGLPGALAVALAVAAIPRLAAALLGRYIVHPDEVWDYLEPAHRHAFGYGIPQWSQELGIRNVIYPRFLAAIMQWTEPLGGPDAYLPAVHVAMALLSLVTVAAACVWGIRLVGPVGGVIAGIAVGTWHELVYFAPRTISETIATDVLFAGLLLALPARPEHGARRLFFAGCLLGAAVGLRLQVAPAAAVAVLAAGWRAPLGQGTWLGLGGLAALAVFGAVDWVTLGLPAQSIWLNVWINTVAGMSSSFGRLPWWHYGSLVASSWTGSAVIVLALAALGALRLPSLAACAAALLVAHSAIAWKEYRFILPAITMIVALAGIGAGMATTWMLAQVRANPAVRTAAVALVALAWCGIALLNGREGNFRREWSRQSGQIEAATVLRRQKELCGIGIWRVEGGSTAGYPFLHRHVPLYGVSDAGSLPTHSPAFDAIIAPDDDLPPLPDYTVLGCFPNGFNETSFNQRKPQICVLKRAGPCRVEAAPPAGDHFGEYLRRGRAFLQSLRGSGS